MPKTTSFTSSPTSHRATFYDEEGQAFDPGTCQPCDGELQELSAKRIQEVVASPWFRNAFEKHIFKPGERQTQVRVILESDRVTVIQGSNRIVAAVGAHQPDADQEVHRFLEDTIEDVNQIYSNCLRNHRRAEGRQERNSYNYYNSSRSTHFTGQNVRGREGSAFHGAEASDGSRGGRARGGQGRVNSYADSGNSDSGEEWAPASQRSRHPTHRYTQARRPNSADTLMSGENVRRRDRVNTSLTHAASRNSDSDEESATASQHSRHLASQRARTRRHESTFESTDALFRGSHFVNDQMPAEDDDELEDARSRSESESLITCESASIKSLPPKEIQVRERSNGLRPATHRRRSYDSVSARELADLHRSNPLYEQINAAKIGELEARLATLEALFAQSSIGSRPHISRYIRAAEREIEIRRSASDSSSSTSPSPTSSEGNVSRRHSRDYDADYNSGTSSTLSAWITSLTSPSGNQANGQEDPLQRNAEQLTSSHRQLFPNNDGDTFSDSNEAGSVNRHRSNSFEVSPESNPGFPIENPSFLQQQRRLTLDELIQEVDAVQTRSRGSRLHRDKNRSISSRSGASSSSSSHSFSLAQPVASLNPFHLAAAREIEGHINLDEQEQLRREALENGRAQDLLETYFTFNTQSRASQKTFIQELNGQILSNEARILESLQECERLQNALGLAEGQLRQERKKPQQSSVEVQTLRQSQPSIEELQQKILFHEKTIQETSQENQKLKDDLLTATENHNSEKKRLDATIAAAEKETQRALQEASNRHRTEINSLQRDRLATESVESFNRLFTEELLGRRNIENLSFEELLEKFPTSAAQSRAFQEELETQRSLYEGQIRDALQEREGLRAENQNLNSEKKQLEETIAAAAEETQRALQEASNRHRAEFNSFQRNQLDAGFNHFFTQEREARANVEKMRLEELLEKFPTSAAQSRAFQQELETQRSLYEGQTRDAFQEREGLRAENQNLYSETEHLKKRIAEEQNERAIKEESKREKTEKETQTAQDSQQQEASSRGLPLLNLTAATANGQEQRVESSRLSSRRTLTSPRQNTNGEKTALSHDIENIFIALEQHKAAIQQEATDRAENSPKPKQPETPAKSPLQTYPYFAEIQLLLGHFSTNILPCSTNHTTSIHQKKEDCPLPPLPQTSLRQTSTQILSRWIDELEHNNRKSKSKSALESGLSPGASKPQASTWTACLEAIHANNGLFTDKSTHSREAKHYIQLKKKIQKLKEDMVSNPNPLLVTNFARSLEFHDVAPILSIYAQERTLLHRINLILNETKSNNTNNDKIKELKDAKQQIKEETIESHALITDLYNLTTGLAPNSQPSSIGRNSRYGRSNTQITLPQSPEQKNSALKRSSTAAARSTTPPLFSPKPSQHDSRSNIRTSLQIGHSDLIRKATSFLEPEFKATLPTARHLKFGRSNTQTILSKSAKQTNPPLTRSATAVPKETRATKITNNLSMMSLFHNHRKNFVTNRGSLGISRNNPPNNSSTAAKLSSKEAPNQATTSQNTLRSRKLFRLGPEVPRSEIPYPSRKKDPNDDDD